MIARLVYLFLLILLFQFHALGHNIEKDTVPIDMLFLDTDMIGSCDQITIFNGSGLVMCGGDSGPIVYQCEICEEPSFARLINGSPVTTNIITTSHCFSLLLAGGHQEMINISIRFPPGSPQCPKPAPINITLLKNVPKSFQMSSTPNGCCTIIEL